MKKDNLEVNGGVQTSGETQPVVTVKVQHNDQKTEQELPLRTSVISVGLKRTLSTAQFETLVIELSTEQEIGWREVSEWKTKFNNWQNIMVSEFKKSHDQILDELELGHKKAYFKNSTPETVARYADKSASASQPKTPNESQLEDLDSLDILGD